MIKSYLPQFLLVVVISFSDSLASECTQKNFIDSLYVEHFFVFGLIIQQKNYNIDRPMVELVVEGSGFSKELSGLSDSAVRLIPWKPFIFSFIQKGISVYCYNFVFTYVGGAMLSLYFVKVVYTFLTDFQEFESGEDAEGSLDEENGIDDEYD